MLTYNELKKRPKEFLAATSHTVEEFEYMLAEFSQCYGKKYSTLTVAGVRTSRM